jgi:hypothetical protein
MDSISNQSFGDYEVLINNDSSDVTVDPHDDRFKIEYGVYDSIADIYQSLFDRVTGKYVWVVEDDDFIATPEILSTIAEFIDCNRSDLLLGSHYVSNDYEIHTHGSEITDGELTHDPENFQFGDMVFNSKYLRELTFMSDRNHNYNDYFIFKQLNALSARSMSIKDVIYILTYGTDNLTWRKTEWHGLPDDMK